MNTTARPGRTRRESNKSCRSLPITALATGLTILSPGISRAGDVAATADAPTASPGANEAADSADGGAGISEVTISGNKERTISLQAVKELPQSISVLTGADLQLQDAVDMGGITRRAANVKWNSGNSREFSFSIRGLGYQSNTEAEDP